MTLVAAVPAALAADLAATAPPGVTVRPVPGRGDPALLPALADVGFLVLDHERADDLAPLLPRLPALRFVQVLIVGTDWVTPFLPPGVGLGRPTGARDGAVAEWVAGALLGAASGLLPAARDQVHARWDRRPRRELAGQQVVVVGQGTTGQAAAALLERLAVRVVRVARRARPGVSGSGELPDLVAGADAVVLLVPLTSGTRHLADAGLLARMPDGALLVNAGRGPVVDTAALLAELRAGRLRAVLDVTDPEPLPAGHPLWTAPGCIVSPHVAGATLEARQRSVQEAARALARYAASAGAAAGAAR
ncbi:NAD(P)-dependent oxidoreductase [Geodermatophilus sp. CPCC 206100]|uniref:NAD(P)-dependent oxidoreductase n=1 Tax=Geodermatophilus sp. CPCC 206100 TaxID=3020054 RepID=UPI003AFFDA01